MECKRMGLNNIHTTGFVTRTLLTGFGWFLQLILFRYTKGIFFGCQHAKMTKPHSSNWQFQRANRIAKLYYHFIVKLPCEAGECLKWDYVITCNMNDDISRCRCKFLHDVSIVSHLIFSSLIFCRSNNINNAARWTTLYGWERNS